MGMRFILMVNKQDQTRLAQYYEWLTLIERRALEGEIVRKCLARTGQRCSFVEHRNYKILYTRYASLLVPCPPFILVSDTDSLILPQNQLSILVFIHLLYELDIMLLLEKAHFMLEEMIMNGRIVEKNKSNILSPIQLMELIRSVTYL
ncbi:hypothetical protein K2173_005338 [Erythroxylum novogranatense]|uniref:AP complex subunit sigma n=1 Tax=Erythroxylum novogranatense TaxID=1862640 RepID=A0AAV8TIQ7_9ROSI|nr:hypothetical protein K2173_005338 [Erythroxylum novogranatense]